jgi:hypothetical protein
MRVGSWRGYLFGVSTCVILTLVARSPLAGQIFAATPM